MKHLYAYTLTDLSHVMRHLKRASEGARKASSDPALSGTERADLLNIADRCAAARDRIDEISRAERE